MKMDRFEKVVKRTSSILAYVGMGMLLVMMFLGSADVLGRYFFNKPITGTYEIFEILLPGIVLLCLADTQFAGGHITMGLLVSRLAPRTRARIEFVIRLILLVLFGLITWKGIDATLMYWHQHRLITNIGVPMYLPQILVPVGALAICPVLVVQMLRSFAQMRKGG